MKKYQNKKSFFELLRYGVTGLATTLINYLFYTILLFWNWNYLAANTAAWTFAVAFAYFANRKLVFQSQNQITKEVFSFVSLRFFTLLLENLMLFGCIHFFSLHPMLSKIFVSIMTVLGNYMICKCHIFKEGVVSHE